MRETTDASSGTSAIRNPRILSPVPHTRITAWLIVLVVLDLLLVSGSLLPALEWNLGRNPVPFPLWVMAVVAPLQMIVFALAGAYDISVPGRPSRWTGHGLRAHGLFLVAVIMVLYLTGTSANVPRLTMSAWACSCALALAITRFLLAKLSRRLHTAGLATRVALIGDWRSCTAMREHFKRHPELDMRAVAIASDDRPENPDLPTCPMSDAAALALARSATVALICADFRDIDRLGDLIDELMPFPVELRLAPNLDDFPIFCLSVSDLAGRPCINLSASPMTSRDHLIKRIEDILLSTTILALISPVLLLIAGGVRLFNGPGPILFAQRRHGLMGRTILVYKFRTMTWTPNYQPGPDEVGGDPMESSYHDAVQAFLNPETGVFRQVKQGDIRVTRFGKFLRASSLDELPQFWNVLKGDMSIVGPRPHARRHNLGFLKDLPHLMRRHFVKPGITGLAQVNGARGRTDDLASMEKRLSLDLTYIRTWSLWLDLKIIAKTLVVGFINREP